MLPASPTFANPPFTSSTGNSNVAVTVTPNGSSATLTLTPSSNFTGTLNLMAKVNYTTTINSQTVTLRDDLPFALAIVPSASTAIFTDSGATSNLALGNNDSVAVVSTGPTYSLSFGTTGTWSGTNDANVTGNGTNTLTVTSRRHQRVTTAINITDTRSAGGDAVSFGNSLSSGYANNFVISLANSTFGSAFTGNSTFTGSSSLTATASGAIVINSRAVVTTAGGAISLVATGTNAPLSFANGNVFSSGRLLLRATGHMVDRNGCDSQQRLGDNHASGRCHGRRGGRRRHRHALDQRRGDCCVVQFNRKRYHAACCGRQHRLQQQPGGGRLHTPVEHHGQRRPHRAGAAYALAVDSSGNLYVGNSNNATISKFAPGSTTASATLTGLATPETLAFDSSGNLYAANVGNATVSKFAPGSTTANAILTGNNGAASVVIDSSGNVYVAGNTVSRFAPGSTTPSATYSASFSNPHALALDSSGDLYVASELNNTVFEFAAGEHDSRATYTAGMSEPYSLAFDSSGNLYVANIGNNTVQKFRGEHHR